MTDLSKEEIGHIWNLTDKYSQINYNADGPKIDLLSGKVLASLFFTESTRTQFSYQSSMLKLGGNYSGFSGVKGTSYESGEPLEDGIHMYDSFCNVIVMRHPEKESVYRAAEVAESPVINCGNGTDEHPTQAILELYAWREFLGGLAGKKIMVAGELKGNRVPHALVPAMAMFDVDIFLAAPKGRNIPKEVEKQAKKDYNGNITKIGMVPPDFSDLKDVMPKIELFEVMPVLERFFPSSEEFESFQDSFNINLEFLEKYGRDDLKVTHPMPRMRGLSHDVDDSKYCYYWKLYRYAIPNRMAVLASILAGE